ncbi:MAG: AsmA family protein [Bacteroidales bacterium]|nr:AsmA family protein [Bacteroidales bacterium]
MKKPVKITLISLGSFLLFLVLAVCITVAVILSPKQLTKIVNKAAKEYLTCDYSIGKTGLTIFKTFPKLGVDIQNVLLVNPVVGATNDTLLSLDHCLATVDVKELIKNRHVEVSQFILQNGDMHLFRNMSGQKNYDVLSLPESKDTATAPYSFNLQNVSLQHVNVDYADLPSYIRAGVKDVNAEVQGQYKGDDASGKVTLKTGHCLFQTLDTTKLAVQYDQLNAGFDGALSGMDHLKGNLQLDVADLKLQQDTTSYIDKERVSVKTAVDGTLSLQKLLVESMDLIYDQYKMQLSGDVQRDTANGDILLDVTYQTDTWPIADVLKKLPASITSHLPDSMKLDGMVALGGTVKGTYNEQSMPVVTSHVKLADANFAMAGMPFDIKDIDGEADLNLDLDHQTDLKLRSVAGNVRGNHVVVNGTVRDLLGKMLCNLSLDGTLRLQDFQDLFPESITSCKGTAKSSVKAEFDYEQIQKMQIDKMIASGTFNIQNLDLLYDDSLIVKSQNMDLQVRFPVKEKPFRIDEWMEVGVQSPHIYCESMDFFKANLSDANIDLFLNDILDSTKAMKMGTSFKAQKATFATDSIYAELLHADGSFTKKDEDHLALKLKESALDALIGDLKFTTPSLALDGTASLDRKGVNTLMQWNPTMRAVMHNGKVSMPELSLPLSIPDLDIDYTMQKCHFRSSKFQLGQSNFSLTGNLYDIDKFYRDEGLLHGTLNLTSSYIDLNEIMELADGFRAPDSLKDTGTDQEDDPFIVPFGMNVTINTNVDKVHYEDVDIRKVGGKVAVNDGVLVLDQMGFTSDAARMQLTALYKTPRRNHLFLGLDFHLLDIKIAELIDMIPEVDTVLPMLKSFAGNAEFHFAVETYLKSNYDVKFSTLRGAAAIEGHDLVVLDNETYQKISKMLKFKKGTTNKIDSLSAEVTIYKNEVDVYPFLLAIDRYKAIISGRHNLDMTYNYNISLVSPIRLGLDVIGTDQRKFKLTKAKYATMFRPEKQNLVEQNVMKLKNQINSSLKANVREQAREGE